MPSPPFKFKSLCPEHLTLTLGQICPGQSRPRFFFVTPPPPARLAQYGAVVHAVPHVRAHCLDPAECGVSSPGSCSSLRDALPLDSSPAGRFGPHSCPRTPITKRSCVGIERNRTRAACRLPSFDVWRGAADTFFTLDSPPAISAEPIARFSQDTLLHPGTHSVVAWGSCCGRPNRFRRVSTITASQREGTMVSATVRP